MSEDRQAGPATLLPAGGHQGEEWELVRRIVNTPPFVRSGFLTKFLLYICDRKLRGRESEITEHQIGIQALGRPATYHPGEDNIVRNYARMLRKRLEEYFAGEGRREPIRIVIPRGQYVPTFESNLSVEVPVLPGRLAGVQTEPKPLAVVPSLRRHRALARKAGAGAAIVLLCVMAGLAFRAYRSQARNQYGLFWGEVFNSKRTTYIVAADSGLALLQDMTGREIPLDEYVNGNFGKEFSSFNALNATTGQFFGAQRFADYTSVADLNAIVGFLRLPAASAGQVIVHYARDMRMDDLKQSNLILLGGPHANPWVQLFEPRSWFRMAFPAIRAGPHVDEREIVNKQPRSGEQATYRNVPGAYPDLTYTILSFLPSMDGSGRVLLIQGENMAGTRAGADFVMNQAAMAPILRKALLKDGSIGSFEVVLETQAVGASAPEAHPIVERYGAQEPK